ncbi:protein NUCLEAR FUSION DEFECTIVE 4-like [Malania oleifera]|uniref:protein NUCLEAR FUSION DEFECTIVE 4-like n=1 Tax=Malania oleifera TaxID=397392 RepID=UPI0025AE7F36|nr:protein NUCLEAR FUSION DEFECTIVE 4-like [Malania oleifera]
MATVKGGTRPPWVGLGAAVWVQIASGNAYNFPLYSHSLKSILGFNQHQLTMLGVANDIGENVGLLPGFVCNKFPPWVVLLIGTFACFFGYGLLWLAFTGTIEPLPYWLETWNPGSSIRIVASAMQVATSVNAQFHGYNTCCFGHEHQTRH